MVPDLLIVKTLWDNNVYVNREATNEDVKVRAGDLFAWKGKTYLITEINHNVLEDVVYAVGEKHKGMYVIEGNKR